MIELFSNLNVIFTGSHFKSVDLHTNSHITIGDNQHADHFHVLT